MISSMTRFEVVGSRDLLLDTLDTIQDVGACHLESAPLDSEGLGGKLARPPLTPADQSFRNECQELAARFEAKVGALPASVFSEEEEIAAQTAAFERRDRMEVVAQANARLTEWGRLLARIENLKEDQALFGQYQRIFDALDSLRVPSGSVVIPLLVDMSKKEAEALVEKIRDIARNTESAFQKLGGGSALLALAVPGASEAEVREYLWEEKISEAAFPQEYADLPPLKIRARIEDRLREIPRELDDLEDELETYVDDYGIELVALNNYLCDSRDRLEAYQKAAVSSYAFQLIGWVPMQRRKEVEDELGRVGGGSVEFQALPTDHDHNPPTHLKNPGFARPFEALLQIFPPVRADGLDPTITMAVTFPIFFGYMVGDAGYGFCMFLMALLLRMKFGGKYPILKDISYIFMLGAISAMFFGICFGEVFGHFGNYMMAKYPFLASLGHAVGLHTEGIAETADPWHHHTHAWIGRTPEYLPKYLAYSLAIGMFHMSVSLGMGIYAGVKHYNEALAHGDESHAGHAANHAIEKVGMLISVWGFFLLSIGGVVPSVAYLSGTSGPVLMKIGGAMVVGGMALITYALDGWQKVTGPIEGVSILANAISYSRLMAVGVAGVVLAGMANDVGRAGFAEGSAMWWTVLCVIAGFFGHVAALLIAVFDPLIQALRLHYVEFFSKFYETGGVPYTPLARKGGSY